MSTSSIHTFFEQPILNSPYVCPARHWELDADGQPTHRILTFRRPADFITPIPKPKRRTGGKQGSLLDDAVAVSISDDSQAYHKAIINEVRHHVSEWRNLPPAQWRVTPETARLLTHWRTHNFSGIRPFFCQIEAVETAIWLTEVAPEQAKYKKYIEHLEAANTDANPGLMRLALKLATGAGKTTVMAMLIAWQTVNAVRSPLKTKFTKGFLVVAPGITIKDRLRVLYPNDPESYYARRELIPQDMLQDMQQARIVITNYHAFALREKLKVATGTRAALEGWRGETLATLETEGEMLQRVMPELMGLKRIVVFNDEAHHCYRERPEAKKALEEDIKAFTTDERKELRSEAEENSEAARIWISGLEIAQRVLGNIRIFDLSATPFFLRGSGYAEGTLFTWTMSDFSLMDALECGIVKLPRVPVSQNIASDDMPIFRNLWEHIGKDMPKKGKDGASLDPLALPMPLQTALTALYGHYEKTFVSWQEAQTSVPPCFIIVCNNTSTSKLVYDYISGFHREHSDGNRTFENGRLALFRNFDDNGDPLARPRTLLIDSRQLEAGDALDASFREAAKDEIERFTREILERGGPMAAELRQGKTISDAAILREVMNTVGKFGQLGESIRCVVSVSMLTEGWDANTVTHVLGVRAFGTQLLCEQVIGRALRRQSYDLNADGLFPVEYADVFGIPFDFTAKPVIVKPVPPRESITVKAIRPDRDHAEITFPRVTGYRASLPEDTITAHFTEDSILVLTPALVGPTQTENAGIIGEKQDIDIKHLDKIRRNTILMHLTKHLLLHKWREHGEDPKLHLFGQFKEIAGQWFDTCLKCSGGTFAGLLLYETLANMACERIVAAVNRAATSPDAIKVVLDPYNPKGSTRHVHFTTTKTRRWQTEARKCHINWAILDSGWEGECCRVLENHPRVLAYVKNQNLGFEIPYVFGANAKHYIPDFIVLVDDGHGQDDLLHLIVEVKGYRGEDAKVKKETVETYWLPGINSLKTYGRWAFSELKEVYEIETDLATKVQEAVDAMLQQYEVKA